MDCVLGLQKGTVSIAPYTAEWVSAFESEKARLYEAFPGLFLEISHGGSTSVPGMSAKPIIDIFAALRDLSEHERVKSDLEALSYEHQGEDGVPGRQFYLKCEGDWGTHHLQLVTYDSPHWDNHIVLREYYKAHPHVRDEYSALKRHLAVLHADNRDAYSTAKKEFVNATLGKARAFAQGLKP